ncbi:MAG: tail fiber protein [Cyclobacteriaceae bacterium]
MKKLYPKSLFLFLALLSAWQIAYTQNFNDKGFSFQGYAKNTEGAALSSENIEVQFSIYQQGQAAEFSEVHTATTDAFGVFHLVVGSINSTDFKKLDFISKPDYKLKVETRLLGGTYATISDAVMQSVPYAQAADNGVPVGTMLIFAGQKASIPAGWLACDGASVSSTAYPKLFSAIGISWGGGSGNFNVPDMRGLFPRGVNDGSGRDPNAAARSALAAGGNTGDNVGTVQGGDIQSHNHGVTDPGHNHHVDGTWNRLVGYTDTGTAGSIDNSPGEFNVQDARVMPSSTTGIGIQNSGGSETRPINVAVWYIIRAR